MKSAAACLTVALASGPIAAEAQSAGKILERHIAAIGGKKAVERIVSTEISGSVVSADGRTGLFTQQSKRPHLITTSISWGSSRWRAGFNGRAAWEDNGNGPQTLFGEAASRLRAEASLASTRLLVSEKVTQLLAAGRGQVRDRPALLVATIAADGAKRTLFFDADSYLLLKDERDTAGGMEERFFDDYRAVDQVLEPHRIEWRRNGETFRIVVSRVMHNAPLDDRMFDLPAAAVESRLDSNAIVSAAARNEAQAESGRASYTYDMVATSGRMDEQGRVTQEETAAYEIVHLGGLQLRKLLRRRGQPLSGAERQREDERVNKLLESFRQGTLRPGGAPRSADGLTIYMPLGANVFSALVRMSEFSNVRRERLQRRAVVVVEFQPRRDAAPKNPIELQASRMAGALWIDEASRYAVRIDSYFRDDFERTIQGSSITMERTFVNDEVWLPSRDEVNLRWSFAFGNRSQFLSTSTYSGHKRFGVETDSGFRLPDASAR